MPDDTSEQIASSENRRRVLLKDKAYEEIKQGILDGRFAPGTFLAERWLADTLEMSKTPVRAAIGRLEAEGFLSVSPQQGIVVRSLSFEEIIDHYDMRIALESFVARRLSGRLTVEQEASLREEIEAQRAVAAASDVAAYVVRDAGFHVLLCKFARNQEIVRVMERQYDKLNRIIHRVMDEDPSRMASSTEEHEAILDAIAEGKGDQAAENMAAHMEYGKRHLISL
ncbi:MAG: GntR family transcriptional regulator [Rhodothermales bacterium]